MLINIADVWDDAETEHEVYVEKALSPFLEIIGGKYSLLSSQEFGKFLTENSTKFALGKPAALRQIIISATAALTGMSEVAQASFFADAKLVFDYGAFCAKNLLPWSAYKLCSKARYNICPYCQQSYAFTVQRIQGGAFRPTLDHYYPKGKYPYLALSLYNLVPSCYSCNSSLKNSKDFYIKPYLHPFCDSEEIGFTWDIQSYLRQRRSGKSVFELKLKFNKKTAASKNSADTFLLNERFLGHESMLEVFVQSIQYWNENPVLNPNVSRTAFRFNFTEHHALGFNKADYKNEMLGKIKLDLYNSLIEWNKTIRTSNAGKP